MSKTLSVKYYQENKERLQNFSEDKKQKLVEFRKNYKEQEKMLYY